MSRSKTLIILLSALVLLIAGCVLMYLKPWQKDESIIIYQGADRLVGLAYNYEGEDIELVRPESAWWVKDNDEFYVDQSKIALMENALVSVQADMVVTESAQDPASFGLAKPYMTLAITEADGDETMLLIGDYNAAGPGYYLQKRGEDRIYMVAASFVGAFSYTMDALEIKELT